MPAKKDSRVEKHFASEKSEAEIDEMREEITEEYEDRRLQGTN